MNYVAKSLPANTRVKHVVSTRTTELW